MKKFADNLGNDLFILPSSVHELILVPECDVRDPDYLTDMIAEVNDTQVSREEILSYSLYRYYRDEDEVRIVRSMKGKKAAAV